MTAHLHAVPLDARQSILACNQQIALERRELARRGRPHALLANPVTQNVAPARGRQASELRHAEAGTGRDDFEIGGGENVEQPAGFAQVRSRRESHCERRRANARAAPAARDGAGSCDRRRCRRWKDLRATAAARRGPTLPAPRARNPAGVAQASRRRRSGRTARRSVRAARRRASAPAASFPADRRRGER